MWLIFTQTFPQKSFSGLNLHSTKDFRLVSADYNVRFYPSNLWGGTTDPPPGLSQKTYHTRQALDVKDCKKSKLIVV
jgi:hypothetical protein